MARQIVRTKTSPITKEVRVVLDGSTAKGVGRDPDANAAGYNSDVKRNRAVYLPFFESGFFDDMRRILAVELIAWPAVWKYVVEGSTPKSNVRRATEAWKRGHDDTPTTDNATIWPGPNVESDQEVADAIWLKWPGGGAYPPNPENKVAPVSIDVTDLAVWWAPAATLGPQGNPRASSKPNYGIVIAAARDDWTNSPGYTGTDGDVELRTVDSKYPPYLRWSYYDNLAPNAPTAFSPKTADGGGYTVVSTASGLVIPTTHTFDDPDLADDEDPGPATDYPTASDYRLYSGSTILATHHVAAPGRARRLAYSIPVPPAYRNAPLKWSVADYDKDGILGDWITPQLVRPNAKPTLDATQVSIDRNSQSPSFTIRLRDADPGATIAETDGIRIRIERILPNGGVKGMTPGDDWHTTSGGTVAVVASESADLPYGERVRAFVQIRDQYGGTSPAEGEPGAMDWIYWTPRPLRGPTSVTPSDDSYKHLSRRPAWTVANDANFTGIAVTVADSISDDENELDGLTLYDVDESDPITFSSRASYVLTYPARGTTDVEDLSWGDEVFFTVAVRLAATGEWTPRGGPYRAVIDSLPDAPLWNLIRDDGTSAPLYTDPIETSDSLDPDVVVPYTDDDISDRSFDEIPVWRSIEIRNATTNALRARIVRRLYAFEDTFRLAALLPLDEPNGLAPSASGWTAGAGTHVLSYSASSVPAGQTKSLKTIVTAQPSSTVVDLGPATARSSLYTDLSGVSTVTLWRRLDGTLTNLTALRLRLHMAGNDANTRDYTIATSATATGSLAEVSIALDSPNASAGTQNLAAVHRISLVWIASGSLTATAYVGRLGIDDLLVSQTTYRLAAKYADDNTEGEWGGAGAVFLKASIRPSLAWGTAPNSADPTPTITYDYNGETDQASYALEIFRRRGLFDLLAERPGALIYWPLDESSGTVATDASGNGRDGTITGAPTLGADGVTGDDRTAIAFTAADKYVSIADAPALQPASFAFAILAKLATLADSAYLVRKTDGSTGSWYLATGSGGATHRGLIFAIRTAAGAWTTLGRWPADGTDPTLANWYLVVGTFDDSTKEGRLFVADVTADADPVQYDAAGAVTTDPVVASAGVLYSSSAALEVGVRGGGASMTAQSFEFAGRTFDAEEVAAIAGEIAETIRDERIYPPAGDDLIYVEDVETDGSTVGVHVPAATLDDDATYWPRITAVDSDGLATVLE